MVDGIIFDLDGTLWDATEVIRQTWNEVLAGYEYMREPITIEELEGCMGLQLDEISRRLFPMADSKLQHELIVKCCDLEVELLNKVGGNLFPKLEETLIKLKERHRLFIVSNCQSGYIESFINSSGLGYLFEDYTCAGDTGLSKGENNRLIMERNRLETAVYVGDTAGDMESARVAGIPFVFARYGFGECDSYEYVVDSFEQLAKLEL
jgi:phosphoglycolate phosphatase